VTMTDRPWVTQGLESLIQIREYARMFGNNVVYVGYGNKVNSAAQTLRSSFYRKKWNN